MTGVLTQAHVVAALTGSTLAFVAGLTGYRYDRRDVGEVGSAFGFGTLAVLLTALAVDYALTGRSYAPIAVVVALAGGVFCANAIRLTVTTWERREQLAATTTVFLVVVLPFELDPSLHLAVQEALAGHVAAILRATDVPVALEATATGHRTTLAFENGAYITVVRECNGVYAVAVFAAILVPARSTRTRIAGALTFAVVAVYAVNVARMTFVASALAGDWFGPLVTSTNTLAVTYAVAELAIGQSIVVVATVAGYLWVGRYVPDVVDFAVDVADTFDRPTRR